LIIIDQVISLEENMTSKSFSRTFNRIFVTGLGLGLGTNGLGLGLGLGTAGLGLRLGLGNTGLRLGLGLELPGLDYITVYHHQYLPLILREETMLAADF
jgi:hypothetical protein